MASSDNPSPSALPPSAKRSHPAPPPVTIYQPRNWREVSVYDTHMDGYAKWVCARRLGHKTLGEVADHKAEIFSHKRIGEKRQKSINDTLIAAIEHYRDVAALPTPTVDLIAQAQRPAQATPPDDYLSPLPKPWWYRWLIAYYTIRSFIAPTVSGSCYWWDREQSFKLQYERRRY